MIKKLFAKLMGWQEQRTNFAERTFRENESVERENAKEREEANKRRMQEERQSSGWQEVQIPEGQEEKPGQ